MENSFLITEENLIGNIASAILQLKKLKVDTSKSGDVSFILKLINFIDSTNHEDYKKLLYDKYFIVSEDVLTNIHKELKVNDLSSKIDFSKFKEALMQIPQNSSIERIEEVMKKLKEIAVILLQVRNQRQTELA